MPNKYPKEPLSIKAEKQSAESVSVDLIKSKMKAMAIVFGGKVQDGN